MPSKNIFSLWWIPTQKMNSEETKLLWYIVIEPCLKDSEGRLWREKTCFGLLILSTLSIPQTSRTGKRPRSLKSKLIHFQCFFSFVYVPIFSGKLNLAQTTIVFPSLLFKSSSIQDFLLMSKREKLKTFKKAYQRPSFYCHNIIK